MGSSSSKESDYFYAYKSIKRIHQDIHNKMIEENTQFIEGVYFIDINKIREYLKILNNLDILKNIADITKRSEVRELEEDLKNDFKKYELEERIDYIKIGKEISKEDFEKEYQNEEFIIVDKDFLEKMKIQSNTQQKIKLNVNKEEIYIELSNNKMIIIIEETEKGNGIYKFVEIKEKEIDYNEDAHKNDENNATKNMSERDVYLLRKFPEGKEEQVDQKNHKGKEGQKEDDKKVQKTEKGKDEQKEEGHEEKKEDREEEKKEIKAPFAEYEQIISSIYFSIQNNLSEQKEIILERIKKRREELSIDNAIEEKDNIDILKNIQESVKALLNDKGNENPQNLDQTKSLNQTYNSIIVDNDNESSKLMTESNQNNNQPIENLFNFNLAEMIDCKKCNTKENPLIYNEYYSLDLNKVCYSLDNCFNLEYQKQCDKCKNNIEYVYKFQSTPEILILKFNNPKEKKNYIQLNPIEKDIDLKKYLFKGSIITKYELIKALYVYNDKNDNNLYVDIPENEMKDYIPYIIIYKKI